MLNIISRSIYNTETRGPKKVVDNLILGLQKIHYPFIINGNLDSCTRLWIHDDIFALEKLKTLDPKIKTIIGPNLFVLPEDIPQNLSLSKTIFVHPCLWTKEVWTKLGFNACPIMLWPVGIDTEKQTLSSETKDKVLIYVKFRNKEDVTFIETLLKSKNIRYEVIIYGSYKHEDYIELLKHTKYIILVDRTESQGIAIEEAMAMNIPFLVWDYENLDYLKQGLDTSGIHITSVPYFDNTCGIIIKNEEQISDTMDTMEKTWQNFEPRKYIVENLSVEKQAKDFLKLYETYYGLSYEAGFSEKRLNNKKWKNATVHFQLYFFIKNAIKKVIR